MRVVSEVTDQVGDDVEWGMPTVVDKNNEEQQWPAELDGDGKPLADGPDWGAPADADDDAGRPGTWLERPGGGAAREDADEPPRTKTPRTAGGGVAPQSGRGSGSAASAGGGVAPQSASSSAKAPEPRPKSKGPISS